MAHDKKEDGSPSTPPPNTSTTPNLAFTTVTNIKTCVPITLSLKEDNYNMWKEYFLILIQRLDLLPFLDGSLKPSSKEDREWFQLDAQIRSWLLNTISVDIAKLIIKTQKTAAAMWTAIEGLYTDNEESRLMELQNKFSNTVKGDMSMTDYCQVMKTLHDGLLDLNAKTDEKALVLQIIRGLPSDYKLLVELIP